MPSCHCDAVSLLMWCDDAFSGCGLSWQIIKSHLLKHFVLAGTNSKECPLLYWWEASRPHPHLLLTPDPTGQPNSREKAVNVKGICEGHSPARTPEHYACPCLPVPPRPAPKQALWIQGHTCVISWSASLSFCLQRMKLYIWKRLQTRISELFKRYEHLLHW